MATAAVPTTLITSVQRALRLLEAASRSPTGAPAKQLARTVGLPIGTTYHLLRTLTFEGYVRRLGDGRYVVGDEVAKLMDRSELRALLRRSRPVLAALRDTVRAAAYLALHERGEVVVKDIQDGPSTPRIDLWVGFRDAAHATALGKCVLAFLDTGQQRVYLARHPLRVLTARTITDRDALLRTLADVRRDGLAVEDEEYLPGTAGLAVPVRAGSLVGAVALSFPRRRLSQLDELRGPLERTAERVARSLALHPESRRLTRVL